MNELIRIPLKYLADVFNGNSIPDDQKDSFQNKEIPYIPTKEIDQSTGTINYDNGLSVNMEDGFRIAPANSSLLCIEGGSAGKKIAFTNRKVAFVNKLCCIHAVNANQKYLHYCLQSSDFSEQFGLFLTGMIGGVTVSDLKNIPVSIVSNNREKQVAIANKLDEHISRIDSLVCNQEEIVQKLKNYKQSIITEVVTRGLNPHVQMKDSGNKWIGTIPESWKISKVKYVSSLVTDGAHVSPDYDEQGYDYISTTNIDEGTIHFEGCIKTSEESYRGFVSSGCKPLKGDVLISKDGSVGKTVIINFDRDFVVGSSLVIIRPIPSIILKEFLNYNLMADFVQKQLLLIMHGTALKRVSVQKNANLPVVLPSIDEQRMIVNYLDLKCSRIDSLIKLKTEKIRKLKEYKKSIIYEFVTGKKEVV